MQPILSLRLILTDVWGGGSGILSVSESLWNFKVHGKLRINTSDTQIELFCVSTCVLFNGWKTMGNAVGNGLEDTVFWELRE